MPARVMVWAALLTAGAAFGETSVPMTLTVGQGVVIDCPEGAARVATTSPEVADPVMASGKEVLVQAKAAGRATLVIWPRTGERRTYEITVEPNLEPIRRLLRETFPEEELEIRGARESVALVGRASSQAIADRAVAVVAASVKGVVSNLQVAPPGIERQVLLRVKFAEVNRNVSTEIGVNLFSTGTLNTVGRVTTGQFAAPNASEVTGAIPGRNAGTQSTFTLSDALNIFAFRPDLNLGAAIRALQARGLIQILAEPNLVTLNGKEATFLAGGEFPVPVIQAGAASGAVTVMFREFGIRLAFTPQVTANGTVRMHVKPEVSSIDASNGVTIGGFQIPSLTTRRMETDVELQQGQSFAIAGLIDDRAIQNFSQVPGLAHIPILGALFKSRAETKTKTELIVIVTPELVGPDSPPGTPFPNLPANPFPNEVPQGRR